MQLTAVTEIMFLLGGVLLVIGGVFRRYRPRAINGIYGYRTGRAMKSEEAWHFAQRLSATYLLRLGLIYLLIGLVFLYIETGDWSPWLSLGLNLLLIVIGLGTLVFLVERKLKKHFPDAG